MIDDRILHFVSGQLVTLAALFFVRGVGASILFGIFCAGVKELGDSVVAGHDTELKDFVWSVAGALSVSLFYLRRLPWKL